VSGYREIRLEWADDGVWIQRWRYFWYVLMRGRPRTFPQEGFVGRVSTSFPDTAPRPWRLHSAQLHQLKRRDTKGAPLWRLIFVWETFQRPLRQSKYGQPSEPGGKPKAADGEERSTCPPARSTQPRSTTSTFLNLSPFQSVDDDGGYTARKLWESSQPPR